MKLRNMWIKVTAIVAISFALSMCAVAQENRSEISIEGAGFFTSNSSGHGIDNQVTNTGGVLIGYRYNLNRWFAAEANYGWSRDTQSYFGPLPTRIQAGVHQITGSAVVKLPSFARLQPFVRVGGGALVFDPTGKFDSAFVGAGSETRGAFLYGAGADYSLTHHVAIRAEYRGYVYETPEFNLAGLNTDSWTHTAQPTAGLVFRF